MRKNVIICDYDADAPVGKPLDDWTAEGKRKARVLVPGDPDCCHVEIIDNATNTGRCKLCGRVKDYRRRDVKIAGNLTRIFPQKAQNPPDSSILGALRAESVSQVGQGLGRPVETGG